MPRLFSAAAFCGFKRKGAAIRSFGLGPTVERFEHNAEIGVENGLVRLGFNGLADELAPFLRTAADKSGHSQKVQRVGLPWLGRKNASIKLLGSVEPTGLMMPQTLFQRCQNQAGPSLCRCSEREFYIVFIGFSESAD